MRGFHRQNSFPGGGILHCKGANMLTFLHSVPMLRIKCPLPHNQLPPPPPTCPNPPLSSPYTGTCDTILTSWRQHPHMRILLGLVLYPFCFLQQREEANCWYQYVQGYYILWSCLLKNFTCSLQHRNGKLSKFEIKIAMESYLAHLTIVRKYLPRWLTFSNYILHICIYSIYASAGIIISQSN